MEETTKGKPIFGLDKVPDEGIIKGLKVELGKERAHIQELGNTIHLLETKLKEYKLAIKSSETSVGVLYINGVNKKLRADNAQMKDDLSNLERYVASLTI